MGNVAAHMQPDDEMDCPPPDYEPNGERVTLTIHTGGTVQKGVYIDSSGCGNIYKADGLLPDEIDVKAIKEKVEHLYAGKEFNLWVSKYGKLSYVRDDTVVKKACQALGGAERELHIYVVEKTDVDEHDLVHNTTDEGSPNVSDFSESDEPYEYDMRDESESESDGEEVESADLNVFQNQGCENRCIPVVGAQDKGKRKVGEGSVQGIQDDDVDDVNVMESGDDLGSPLGSDDDNERCIFPTFHPENLFKPSFEVGMLFNTKKELKVAIQSNAINEKRSVKFMKNDKRRLYAMCSSPECPWIIRGLAIDNQACFRIREYVAPHTCKPKSVVDNVSSTWLAAKFKDKFINDPSRNINAWRVETIAELKVHVTEQQAYKTKYKALKMIDGQPEKQYELLWMFVGEVKRSNPGSSVVIETNGSSGRNIFDRMYICLHALKEGFNAGCRPVICLDGCWLKGIYGGVLFTACGIDANNSYLPVTYAKRTQNG